MSEEPLVYQMQTEMKIIELKQAEEVQPEAIQQAVGAQSEGDPVFSRETCEIVSGLLAAQVSLGMLHHLAAETFQRTEERPIVPPREREKKPDEE